MFKAQQHSYFQFFMTPPQSSNHTINYAVKVYNKALNIIYILLNMVWS